MSRRQEISQGAQQVQTDVFRQASAIRNYILFNNVKCLDEFDTVSQRLKVNLEALIARAVVAKTREELTLIQQEQV